jgi:hypothetical protein
LESWLGASPHGFESHILREHLRVSKTLECETAGHSAFSNNREAEGGGLIHEQQRGKLMNPQLPSTYDFLWIIGGGLSLLPLANTILLAFILRQAVRIRRNMEKND